MAIPGEVRGYWKYMVVLGAAIVNFLNTGTGKSFGVLIPDLKREFDTGVSILGFGIGMCHGVAVGLTFVSRPLLTKTTCQVLTMIGGVVAVLGFCLCSASSNAVMFVTGIGLAGFGYSFMIISNIVIVKDYFPSTYAAAVSFSFSGGAVGMMLIPVITEKLQNIYGWRGALLLIAGINLHNVVAGALFRPLSSNRRHNSGSGSRTPDEAPRGKGEALSCTTERTLENSQNYKGLSQDDFAGASASANEPELRSLQNRETQMTTTPCHGSERLADFSERSNGGEYYEQSFDTSESDDAISEERQLISRKGARTQNDFEKDSQVLLDEEQSLNGSGRSSVTDLFDLRLMCDYPAINLVMIGALLAGATTTGWVAFLVPDGQEKGYQLGTAVLLATIGGSGNIIGRFCIGYMIGQRITARGLFIACNIICGVAFYLNSVAFNFWVLSILATINGFTLGAMMVLICLMVEEIADDSRFASGVALAYFFLGTGEILGGLFAGWLYDISHTYNTAFIALGSLNFIGALLTMMSLCSCSRCRSLLQHS